jgi:sterol desaturase/sphingolipid hydroxylase (fatty acid hydroxylase superfamily)
MYGLFTTAGLVEGFILLLALTILTAAFEYTCWGDVKALLGKKGGKQLYQQAVTMNLFNTLVIAPFTFAIVVHNFCAKHLTLSQQMTGICGVVIIQNYLFFLVHWSFHAVKGLFWIHAFHHKFNEILLPSAAMAVGVAEFLLAYMAPIVIGASLMPVDRTSTIIVSLLTGVPNVLIHTPWMVGKTMPSWLFVTADDHFRHHRKLTTDYAAPLLSFDRIFGYPAATKVKHTE